MESKIKVKKCTKCGVIKEFNEYFRAKYGKYGFASECKVCVRKRKGQKAKIIENLPIINKRCSRCQKIKLKTEFGICKREKDGFRHCCKSCRLIYDKNPYIKAWRRLLESYLKRTNRYKNNKTIELLGYSALDLKNHIEIQFTDGMSWNNYGEWHIDHIKPLAKFDKHTPPHIVNALTNLRPLWATTREINGVVYEGNLNRKRK